ncbi:Bro-N domain-containing protein [Candidatus Woesearchaeota archaeon]|jgi:DNA-damage-inducible protein D|nr:Bro-N domain-containing protein [Candidatus Woesearchaeota archaeon]MBT6520227.1 Bro-N domain-containing protein [Candidatus Woesearchaeota archaeon]MBT7367238.1 Bro-N domain-containing protein [Candidatus Woesearchaeota archaeon]
MQKENALVVFQDKKIRRTWYNDEWWFSVVDVISALTDQADYLKARKYWNKLKQRLTEEGSKMVTKCHQLKLLASDGKNYLTDCAKTESLLRLIQSIPSKKAEPFKQWLAKVGYERVQEIENPELAQDRARKYYELKGYPASWIEKRLRGIAIRQDLTTEWKIRGVQEGKEFAILTNEISTATFGVPINDHKKLKGLEVKHKNQNLRDHMTDLELIFSMLGEKLTTEVAKKDDAQGFDENKDAAKKGGSVAGRARKDAEDTLGINIVSKDNYIDNINDLDIKKLKDKNQIKKK